MRVCPREARVGSQRQQWGRCGLCTCSPCQRSGCLAHPRRPRRPAFFTSAPGCGLTRLFPEGHGARTHREPTRPETRTHFANPLFANPLSANPREPTANPPVSRTHLANPREPNAKHYGVSHANPLASGFEKSGFEQKWVRGKVGSSRDNPEPTWQAFRSGFDPPSPAAPFVETCSTAAALNPAGVASGSRPADDALYPVVPLFT